MQKRLAILGLMLVLLFAAAWAGGIRQGGASLRIEVEGRGTIVVRLHTDKAPKATSQIIRLARQGFYDGQRWFRVVQRPRPFLIQTGDPQSKDSSKLDSDTMGTQGSGSSIPFEETGLSADEGAVCLASKPGDRNSGDSQFFILMGTYKFLEGEHTVFGKVTQGMDVVKSIQKGDKIVSVRVVTN